MCARRTGEGPASPSPEAVLAAVAGAPPSARPNGPGLASAAASRPPGSPPLAKTRSGALPFRLAAYALRAGERRYGVGERAVQASQVVSTSLRSGLQEGSRVGELLPSPQLL